MADSGWQSNMKFNVLKHIFTQTRSIWEHSLPPRPAPSKIPKTSEVVYLGVTLKDNQLSCSKRECQAELHKKEHPDLISHCQRDSLQEIPPNHHGVFQCIMGPDHQASGKQAWSHTVAGSSDSNQPDTNGWDYQYDCIRTIYKLGTTLSRKKKQTGGASISSLIKWKVTWTQILQYDHDLQYKIQHSRLSGISVSTSSGL